MDNKWYVVQAYSGSEKSVLKSIEQRAGKANLSNLISEILVPSKKVVQVKKGKKVEVEKNFFPGYVLVNMDLTNELWHLIKEIPKVSGFISQGGKPVPLGKQEVDEILTKLEDDTLNLSDEVEYEAGESVRITDGGPFDSFTGVIEQVMFDKKQLVVSVTIFGRSTPVNLAYNQVEKI